MSEAMPTSILVGVQVGGAAGGRNGAVFNDLSGNDGYVQFIRLSEGTFVSGCLCSPATQSWKVFVTMWGWQEGACTSGSKPFFSALRIQEGREAACVDGLNILGRREGEGVRELVWINVDVLSPLRNGRGLKLCVETPSGETFERKRMILEFF